MKYLKQINWNLLAAIWLIMSFCVFAVPVEASSNITGAKFYGIITVANNGTATTLVSTNSTNMNTTGMISGGYVNSTLSDAAVVDTSGTDVAFMPGYGTNAWTFWVPSADASSYQSYLLYSGNVTGGKTRYFPDANGMTTTDSASLELGSNFTVRQSGYVDTSSGDNKFLFNKPNAMTVDAGTSAAGKVTANIYSTLSQDTGSYVQAIYGGAYTRSGQKFTTWSAGIIGGISIPVSKTGSPTGTASVTVRSVSDDTLLGTLGTFDVSTVTGASVTVSNPVIVPTAQSVYILVEYSGGNASNCINLTLVTPSAYANGNAVVYSGSYSDFPNYDLRWTNLSYPVVTTNATVASGEHDIQVQADGTNLLLDIDGVNVDSVALAGASVPDNANDIISFENGSILYAGSDDNLVQKISVGGVEQQDIGWEYAATFTDQSGNSHDATPTFQTTSTDGDVSATLTSFQPVSESKAPGYTLSSPPNFITSTPAVSGNFSTTVSPTFPGVDILEAAATSGGTPVQLAVLIPVSFGIMALSLFLTWLMKRYSDNSQLVKFGAIFILMGICISTRTYDLWMLIFFLIIGVAIMFGARESRIGG